MRVPSTTLYIRKLAIQVHLDLEVTEVEPAWMPCEATQVCRAAKALLTLVTCFCGRFSSVQALGFLCLRNSHQLGFLQIKNTFISSRVKAGRTAYTDAQERPSK